MHVPGEVVDELNQGVYKRYIEGDPLDLPLYGHHPDFQVHEARGRLTFEYLESDSINLIGRYPLRNVVTIGDASEDEASLVVVYDGKHYYANEIFGSYVSRKTLTVISKELELPHRFV